MVTRSSIRIKRKGTLGALTWEALVAIGVLTLAVLVVTSLSVRQLALLRQTAKATAREQLARATITSVEADPEMLHPRTESLEPVIAEGVTYQREISIREVEERLLELRCRLIADKREFLYVKKVIAP